RASRGERRARARAAGRKERRESAMMRLAGFSFLLAMLTLAVPARAGTYLSSAALLLDEVHRSDEWMQWHYGDVNLADTLHQLSEARVKCGRKLLVRKEADRAHPHLLRALAASERPMAAAQDEE